MVDFLVHSPLTINSHTGQYTVTFTDQVVCNFSAFVNDDCHVIVDANIARLYSKQLSQVLIRPSTIVIEASEDAKSLSQLIPIIDRLIDNKIRKTNHILAIGGGVIQDITCFIASILLRGIEWKFIPTTLLAQADSCIGSKSSINLTSAKNMVGTFYPPRQIWIDTAFLKTLSEAELRSGIGEILKVHAIDSKESFDDLANELPLLLGDTFLLEQRIHRSLLIKKRFIEIDEFDRGVRNIFNFGHSFGHAIEAATNFAIPHGIAVTMGMDIACHIACARSMISTEDHERMAAAFRSNFKPFSNVKIPLDLMFNALAKDKKNSVTDLGIVLPVGKKTVIELVRIVPDDIFKRQLEVAVAALT